MPWRITFARRRERLGALPRCVLEAPFFLEPCVLVNDHAHAIDFERGALGVLIPILIAPTDAPLSRAPRRLLELCDGAEQPAERVYQMQLTLFPLSEKP